MMNHQPMPHVCVWRRSLSLCVVLCIACRAHLNLALFIPIGHLLVRLATHTICDQALGTIAILTYNTRTNQGTCP